MSIVDRYRKAVNDIVTSFGPLNTATKEGMDEQIEEGLDLLTRIVELLERIATAVENPDANTRLVMKIHNDITTRFPAARDAILPLAGQRWLTPFGVNVIATDEKIADSYGRPSLVMRDVESHGRAYALYQLAAADRAPGWRMIDARPVEGWERAISDGRPGAGGDVPWTRAGDDISGRAGGSARSATS